MSGGEKVLTKTKCHRRIVILVTDPTPLLGPGIPIIQVIRSERFHLLVYSKCTPGSMADDR